MSNNQTVDKQQIYDTIFSLIEEELHQRLNSTSYKDSAYDGSKYSICGSSNLDIPKNESITSTLTGGASLVFKRNFIPGKFEVVKYSHNLPLSVALKGSVERQKLFLKERTI